MPASGGHEVCWSFYVAVDEALEAGDIGRLRLLWEVSNPVTVRLRLNPTADQLGLDRLCLNDQLRVSFMASGVQSFFFLCIDLFSLPALSSESTASGVSNFLLSGPKLVALLGQLGVAYKGKPVDKGLGHAMLACAPFALDRNCREAVAFLERIDPKSFDDATKVMRCCQRISKVANGNEFLGAFCFSVECMAVSLMAGDVPDASNFTVEVLAGKGKSEPGLMHTAVTKQKLQTWFFQ